MSEFFQECTSTIMVDVLLQLHQVNRPGLAPTTLSARVLPFHLSCMKLDVTNLGVILSPVMHEAGFQLCGCNAESREQVATSSSSCRPLCGATSPVVITCCWPACYKPGPNRLCYLGNGVAQLCCILQCSGQLVLCSCAQHTAPHSTLQDAGRTFAKARALCSIMHHEFPRQATAR